MNFWEHFRVKKQGDENPVWCLAPMADVTDPAFRIIISKYGKPDVMWTEFVSADGLCHPAGREKLLRDLVYTKDERPIVAQLFSSNPENMRAAAKLASELGYDGIDINMGCPDKAIERQGCGSAMIRTPEKAKEIIQAAKAGIAESGRDIPLSVKTRIGYSEPEIGTWIRMLLSEDIAALTVHMRTRKDLSKVPARWEYMSEIVALRDQIAPHTTIIGNGDIYSLKDGREKKLQYGCDGIMVGRAILGNPWFFDASRDTTKKPSILPAWLTRILPNVWRKKLLGSHKYAVVEATRKERLSVLVEHAALFETILGDIKGFHVMKKHFKAYINGFKGSKELRTRLMEEVHNSADLEQILKEEKNL